MSEQTTASPSSTHYAAIGDDGRRPVVWGIGRTEKDARLDTPIGCGEVDIVAIDAERYARIEGGDVDAADLWNAS